MKIILSSPGEIVCPSPTKSFEANKINPFYFIDPASGLNINKKSNIFNFSDDTQEKTIPEIVNLLKIPLSPKGFQIVSTINVATEVKTLCEENSILLFNRFENMNKYKTKITELSDISRNLE